jgi:hypothetical protein
MHWPSIPLSALILVAAFACDGGGSGEKIATPQSVAPGQLSPLGPDSLYCTRVVIDTVKNDTTWVGIKCDTVWSSRAVAQSLETIPSATIHLIAAAANSPAPTRSDFVQKPKPICVWVLADTVRKP